MFVQWLRWRPMLDQGSLVRKMVADVRPKTTNVSNVRTNVWPMEADFYRGLAKNVG
jgi:hypothetical protein